MEDATISNDDDQRGDGITASDLRRSYFVYAPVQAKGNNVTTLVPDLPGSSAGWKARSSCIVVMAMTSDLLSTSGAKVANCRWT